MRKSLIVYETQYGTSKKVAEICSLIIGTAKLADINAVPTNVDTYDNAIFVFGFYGYNTAKKTKEFIRNNKEKLLSKRVAVIGVGISVRDLDRYAEEVFVELGRKLDFTAFVQGELIVNKLTVEDKKVLEKFFDKANIPFKDMGQFKKEDACNVAARCAEVLNKPSLVPSREELIQAINEFVLQHNTCALGTGAGEFVRSTPIEYLYLNDAFYFISEGGFKFKAILQNPNVCIAIYNEYTDMQNLKGLQVSGKAEIIPLYSEEYNEVMKAKGLNLKNLSNMPIVLNLFKVKVSKFEFLNSEFRKNGFDAKQVLEMSE